MADVFGHFGLATGSNDGTSWEDAYQTPAAFTAGLSADDVGLVKEHAGYTMAAAFTVAVNCAIHFGFDSALTGTSYSLPARTGYTVLNGNAGAYRALDLSANVTISRLEVYNYSFSTAPLGNFSAGDITFDTCVFRNSASTGSDDISGVRVADPATLTCTDCEFHTLTGGSFGAIRNEYATMTLSGCYIHDNSGSFGAAVAIYAGGTELVTIEDCVIADNTGTLGGAVYALGSDGPVVLRRCWLTGNAAPYGSAIYVDSGGNALTLNNCVVAGNTCNYSGAIRFDSASGYLNIVQCTIADNSTSDTDCAGVETSQDPYIADCIFWGNTGAGGAGSQILSSDTAGVVDYCDVDGLAVNGISGIATISNSVDADPVFVGSGNDPYDLTGSSPTSVTEGGSVSVTGYQDFDVLNNDRPASNPSIGAYQAAAASTNPCSIAVTVASQSWTASGSQSNTAAIAITSAAQLWFAQGAQENEAAISIEVGPQAWDAEGFQENEASIAIEVAAQEWLAVAAEAGTNPCVVAIQAPWQAWALSGEQANAASLEAEVPWQSWSVSGSQENQAVISINVGPQAFAAEGTQSNQAALDIVVAGQSWDAYGSSPVNACTIDIQVPYQDWSATGSQENAAIISIRTGHQIWSAVAGVALPEDAFNPTLDVKLEKLREGLEWAFGCRVVYGRTEKINDYRPSGDVWGRLDLMFAGDVEGYDVEIRDVDISAYDGVTPRQEVAIRQTQLRFQVTLRSRDQRPSHSAWAAGLKGMSRVKLPWFVGEFLEPYNLAIGEFKQLTDRPFSLDNRVEDMAVFELLVYTVMVECDEAARGGWIERVEATSDLGLPATLEWNEEIIPEEE